MDDHIKHGQFQILSMYKEFKLIDMVRSRNSALVITQEHHPPAGQRFVCEGLQMKVGLKEGEVKQLVLNCESFKDALVESYNGLIDSRARLVSKH